MLIKRIAGLALALAAMNASAGPEQAIQQTLDRMEFPAKITSVKQTPIAGLYQVQLEGGGVLYASADGQYMMQGSLFLSLIHISEPTRRYAISYAVFCLKKKK